MRCPICQNESELKYKHKSKEYYSCPNCYCIFLNPEHRLNPEQEKARYDLHQNNIENRGYIQFIEPILNYVRNNYNESHSGLDYGSGPNPVLADLLKKELFSIEIYDPYYSNNSRLSQNKYDFIICCEVMEHFYNPHEEFERLKELLNTNGKLICKTSIYSDNIDFLGWHYKNDATHVIFYSNKTIKYLSSTLKFERFTFVDSLIIFE